MKEVLKYIAIIIVCATAIYGIAQIKGCGSNNVGPGSIVLPADTNFTPIEYKFYQPSSLPFSKKKSPVKLPAGMREKDVKRVVSVTVNDIPKSPPKKIDIIETKAGETFVYKDSSIQSVNILTFEPPVVGWDLRFGAGISMGLMNERIKFSPSAIIAPVEWMGWLRVPAVIADIDGFGAGGLVQVYYDIYCGPGLLWRYDQGTQLKIVISYLF
jgi:hypothetical protein